MYATVLAKIPGVANPCTNANDELRQRLRLAASAVASVRSRRSDDHAPQAEAIGKPADERRRDRECHRRRGNREAACNGEARRCA